MTGRLLQHARERLNFTGDVPVAKRLAACKTFLRLESAMIRMQHDAGQPGLKVAQARAAMIDALLAHLFDYAINTYTRLHGKLPSPVALLALGGYGRGELSPLSDVDIMFLFSAKTKPAVMKPLQEHLSNEILYILWDCGLKVGHSSRTLDDVFTEAHKDIQTKTALLESRLIAGSNGLYDTFAQAYRSFYLSHDPKGYIAARLVDQANRRAKFGDTVFLQEPDIKNGVGGLRDYQNALWMARVRLGITTLDELAGAKLPAEKRASRLSAQLRLSPARPQRTALHQQARDRRALPRHPVEDRAAPRLHAPRDARARRGVHARLLPRGADDLPRLKDHREPPGALLRRGRRPATAVVSRVAPRPAFSARQAD